MIKDIVVNLPVDTKHDVTTDFAASMAGAFNAHLAAIAFVHRPIVPGSLLDGAAAGIIQAQRVAAEEAAQAAIARFEETARRNGLSAESRWLDSDYAGIAGLFAGIARRFDISVVAQAEPDSVGPERQIAEAALFESGRPVLIVPYIQKSAAQAGPDDGMLGRQPQRRPRHCRCAAVPGARQDGRGLHRDRRTGKEQRARGQRHRPSPCPSRPEGRGRTAGCGGYRHRQHHSVACRGYSSADLIVMGGYGHSRLREFVLGGATREILSSMTVPVLMSH